MVASRASRGHLVRTAAHASGQHKQIPHTQHAVGLPGRFELELQLPLHHKDEVNLRGKKQVLIDRLGQLPHPDHFYAPSGKHRPGVPERRGPDLVRLPAQDIKYLRARLPAFFGYHGTECRPPGGA